MISELLDRYGLTMDLKQLGELIHMTPGSIRSSISAGTFPIPTIRIGMRRLAFTTDVARYIDESLANDHNTNVNQQKANAA